MGSETNRPAGITAVSTLLVTIGAVVAGAAIVALCADIRFLASAAGLRYEATMLGFVFSGLSFGGFGIGLYEGYAWSRPASLAGLAFVATLQVFSLASTGLASAASYSGGVLALVGTSVVYLSLPTTKRFFHSVQQPVDPAFAVSAEPAGALQEAS